MKIPKRAYTAEFKEVAVKRVKDGLTVGTVAKELELNEQTLRNWVKAAQAGVCDSNTLKSTRKSGAVLRERCAVKYAWMDAQRQEFDLNLRYAVLASRQARSGWKG